MKKIWPYVWKIIWFVGLVILTIISYNIEQHLSNKVLYNVTPLNWSHFIIHFIWGIYLSLICINRWKIQFNFPLFICVFIPSFVLSLYLPLTSVSIINIPVGMWFAKVYSSGLIEIVAGLSLMVSLFYPAKNEKENIFL